MEIPTILILLCCAYFGNASNEGHTIPVENYETELHNLGEHVEIPETPIKVIKITKTVAVKVPVPYPVKVIEKVPYPVHINKPYPVPVPQIVKVPHVESPKRLPEHQPIGSSDDLPHYPSPHSQGTPTSGNSYEAGQSYNGGESDHPQYFAPYENNSSEGSPGSSYEAPSHNYHSNAGNNNAESFETKSYDQAIKNYLQNLNLGNTVGAQHHSNY